MSNLNITPEDIFVLMSKGARVSTQMRVDVARKVLAGLAPGDILVAASRGMMSSPSLQGMEWGVDMENRCQWLAEILANPELSDQVVGWELAGAAGRICACVAHHFHI